ncbi:HEAT repeat domain-containing protein [Aliiroseovarius sp. Z3]|uniref:HEAT repeat domain-containing protein n=1 Tax=Aliiroseovarius sp. Z3 TaxID=2811402 RepID=UPI0023B286C4|nr:HEAT repeat domain-containing protein [Aliiroseovarius sp. Z3]MDE9451674.1 HEAT repeat domain-containing protein [Aliiroseovarius sp. Z3]
MKTYLAIGLFVTLLPTALSAQKIDIEAIKSQAAADASEFAELRALLRNEDANIRLAAFDAMVTHGDPSLYEIATSMAIADVDEIVRARALWEILSRLRTMAILVDPEGEVQSEEARKSLEKAYQGRMSFQVGNAIKDENCVNLYYNKENCVPGYNLTVNGTRINFVFQNQNLDGTLKLDGDGALRGMFRNTRFQIEFPVEIPLR